MRSDGTNTDSLPPPSIRLFVARREEPRSRRAGDLAALAASIIGLALISLVAAPPARLEVELARIIAAIPSGLDGVWRVLVGMISALAVAVTAASLVRRRWALVRDIGLVVTVAVALGLVLGRIVDGNWGLSWSRPSGMSAPAWSPWLLLVIPAAVSLVAKPHLTRTWRRVGWWLLGSAAFGAVLLGVRPTLAAASVLIAVISSATVHLTLGSSRGRPTIEDVTRGLAALGVETVTLGAADRQSAGVFLLEGVDTAGRTLVVKVYGRDAYDTQLLSTMWRTIWFRGPDSPTSPGRLQQVEHEAFVTLLAAQAGVLTRPVVTGGLAPNEDALLVLVSTGLPVASSPEGWDESKVRAMWEMLATLHSAGITHSQVDDRHLIVDGGRVGLVDFRSATVGASEWLRLADRSQALMSSVLALGEEDARRVAVEELGVEGVAQVLPFLQPDPLTPHLRRRLREAGVEVDAFREATAEAIGVPAPELEKLRRITWGSALKAVLPVLAFLALVNVAAGIDFADLASSLEEASWWFIAVGLLVSQVPRLFQAMSALGASPIPVPMSRLYLLQLAQSYIALTIPGAAARVAVNVRFFQRHGLPSGTALAVGALDSFAGFLGQMVLLGAILLFTTATVDLDFDSDTTSGLVRLVTVIAVIAVAALLVLLLVPRFRRRVVDRVRTIAKEGWEAARGLASPRRLGLLFGGNVGNEVLLAVGLGAFTIAIGHPVGLAELIVINVTVSLLAGVIPVPGGIGVVEGGLMLGLARAGVPEEAAFAAAILFRIASFYLPPLWGYFAFRWLEKNKHL